jgi:Protein of unknown function (DUF3574)
MYKTVLTVAATLGLSAMAFTATLLSENPGALAAPLTASASSTKDLWNRTELFFGSGKPDGSSVTEAEFRSFVDEFVTPRFPDGLTLLTGYGQFKGASGKIVRERSFVLVLPYQSQGANAKLEAIRSEYKRAFHQESVLRVDDTTRVSF